MRKTALAVVALPVLAAGCAGIENLARSAFEEPKLTFRSAKVDALDLDGATVAFIFDLTNPNAIGVDVARAAWAVEVDGTGVAAGDLPAGLAIPAKGTAPISFPVRVRFRDVPGIVGLLSSGKDELPYRLSGTLGVRTPLGVVDLPLSHSDRVRLPKLPRFTVDGLSVRSVSISSVGLDVRLRVRNPNGFPLPAGELDYALAFGGARVARAEGARIESVPGGASAVLEIPVRVDLASAGRAASNLLRGGEVDVELTGKADVAGLPLPLDLRARVPARR
ncbi:MAG TPA: LEA type 2 family protein [Anaeromyxobacter sp.]